MPWKKLKCCDRPRSPKCDLFHSEPQFIRDVLHPKLSLSPNLTKPDRSKNYNSYTAPFPKYEFQINLMDVTSLLRDVGSEIKSQLRYGLICIDIFSKKCHIVPIENKDGDDVYKAVMQIFKVLGQPLSIYSDDEGALNSMKLQTFFKEEGITHVITKTHANQAERMIRTVKKNDWGEIEALQNQNMGGSAKAIIE